MLKKVVLCEPGKMARIEEIDASLEGMQKIVGGLIETICPFEDEVCLVCNEEGKLLGQEMNRCLFDENGRVQDVVCGPMFIIGAPSDSDSFESLTDELAEKYREQYEFPERLARCAEGFVSIQYKPVEEDTAEKTAEEKMYLECWGETYEVELETTSYADNGTLAIQMLSEKEPFAVITLNLNNPLQDETHAFLDTNNCPWVEEFVEKYGLATFTGAYGESGFCTYPLYQFNLDVLNKGRGIK